MSRSFVEGPRLHTIHGSVRARRLKSQYGGSAPVIDLGPRLLGEPVPEEAPDGFDFGELTRDRVRQMTYGLAWEGRWRGVGEASLGIQKTDYRKMIALPAGIPATSTRDKPWLFNASAAAHLASSVALYAGYTRGLEESGIAPNNAANRNEALPAIRTRQADAGVRWAVNGRMTLVAGAFDVRKPYFNTDEANRFVVLGDVRHRGLEFSLAGKPTDSLSLVAGAVLMRPRVTGDAVELGRIGKKPLNQSARILRGNVEYRPTLLPDLSFDAAVSHYGERAASRDNVVILPAYTLVDLGVRYRFKIGRSPATLRLQLQNVGNTFYYDIDGSNTYGLTDTRRASLYIAADF